jgi:RNA polymerase sigma factor (sigma-70 family)
VRAAKSEIDIEDLARRMSAFDELAFKEFADMFGPRFKALFSRRGLPMAEAEDLSVSCVTDIALKVNKYRPTEGGSFEGWVFTLAHRYLIDWWRARRATVPLPDGLAYIPTSSEEFEPNLNAVFAVRDAMAQLSETDQLLIRLRNLGEEYSYDEIGRRLGLRADTARVRHFRAMKRLKIILEKDSRIQRFIHRVGGGSERKDDE